MLEVPPPPNEPRVRRWWGTSGIPFPSTGKRAHLYWREWRRRRRAADAELRRKEAKSSAAWRAKHPERNRQINRAWRQRNREHRRRYYREYYMKYRARRCFFCNRRGKRGGGGLGDVERLVPEHGQLVLRTVPVCRDCRGGA